MQSQIDEIKQAQKHQGEQLDKICNALIGTEFTDNKGMIHAVQQNTKFRRSSGYFAAFFTTIGTVIGGFLHWLRIKLFGI